jgi:hypothetical protein
MTEKSIRLPDREEMRRRLETVVNASGHPQRELFFTKMLELADIEANAPFIADVLLILVNRLHAGDATPEPRERSRALGLKIIEALIEDWDAYFRTKLIFLDSSCHMPGM